MLPGPGDGPAGPVLVPGGSGWIGQNFFKRYALRGLRAIISCSQIQSSMLPGPGDGPAGPVLVPGGSGWIGQNFFSTDMHHGDQEVSFPGLRFTLACSLGQGMVQLDLFVLIMVPFWQLCSTSGHVSELST